MSDSIFSTFANKMIIKCTLKYILAEMAPKASRPKKIAAQHETEEVEESLVASNFFRYIFYSISVKVSETELQESLKHKSFIFSKEALKNVSLKERSSSLSDLLVEKTALALYALGYTNVLENPAEALTNFQRSHQLHLTDGRLSEETFKKLDQEVALIEGEFKKLLKSDGYQLPMFWKATQPLFFKSIMVGKLKDFALHDLTFENIYFKINFNFLSALLKHGGHLRGGGIYRASPLLYFLKEKKVFQTARKDAGLAPSNVIDREILLYLLGRFSNRNEINNETLKPVLSYLMENGLNIKISAENTVISPQEAKVLFETLRLVPLDHLRVVESLTLRIGPINSFSSGDVFGNNIAVNIDQHPKFWQSTLLHEIGHIVDYRLRMGSEEAPIASDEWRTEPGFWENYEVELKEDDPDIQFYNISFKGFSETKSHSKAEDFVSSYAATHGPNDFAETYSRYILDGPYFQYLIEENDVLRKKYDFMKTEVFKGREYRYGDPLIVKPTKGLLRTLRKIDAAHIMGDIKKLVSFQTRMSGTEGGKKAFEWLESRAKELGLKFSSEKFVYHKKTYRNLTIDFKGHERPNDVILIMAHYDSTNKNGDPFSPAFGADDNASGVALLLEFCRIIKKHRFDKTIRIVFTDGEEEKLVGAAYHINLEGHGNERIVSALNFDMVGHLTDSESVVHLTSIRPDYLLNRYLASKVKKSLPQINLASNCRIPIGDSQLMEMNGYSTIKITDHDLISNDELHVNDIIDRIDVGQIENSSKVGLAIICLLAGLNK
jgi:hypothetical protein